MQRRTENRPIVVHCRSAKRSMNLEKSHTMTTNYCLSFFSDTVSMSGMFCAIATTIDRCKTESVVDVFQVVKAQRLQKPGLVLTVVNTS